MYVFHLSHSTITASIINPSELPLRLVVNLSYFYSTRAGCLPKIIVQLHQIVKLYIFKELLDKHSQLNNTCQAFCELFSKKFWIVGKNHYLCSTFFNRYKQ